MIPKRIIQCWIWDQSKKPIELMQTWIDKNPTWEYILYTEENMPKFINQKQYNEINELCWKIDIARYELLYNYWWFYIDADSECIEPLDDLLLNNKNFSVWENEKARPWLIANWYIGAEKWSLLMKECIDKISNIENINEKRAWQITWPTLFTDIIMNNWKVMDITIYPSYYFIPKHFFWIEYKWDWKIYAKQKWYSTFNNFNFI